MTQQNEVIIEANGLGYQVGKQHILYDINWRVQKGERWLLYGMNGCGKTTLLSVLAGFRQQTKGTLALFGQSFTNENILQLRQQIGWISSSFFDSRYRHERVLDIVLSGKFGTYGLDLELDSRDYKRAKALLAALSLDGKYGHSYDQLSKGQRQDVLIARAFMHKPQLLLLDEHCSGLDVMAKSRFMELLTKLMQEEGFTVLFVSHEVKEVQDLFSQTLLLRNGRIFAQGATEKLLAAEKLTPFLQQQVAVQEIIQMQVYPIGAHQSLDLGLFMGTNQTKSE